MPPVSQAFARTMGTLPPLIPKPEPVDPEPDMPIDMEGVNPAPPSLLAFAAPKKAALTKFDPATASPEDVAIRPVLSRLQQDEQKDLHPWGTEENHPGFWGKLGHVASVAAGIPDRRKYAEMGLADNLRQMLGSQSEENLQGAQAEHQRQQTEAGQLVTITPEMAKDIGNDSLAGQDVTQSVLQHLMTTARSSASRENVADTRGDASRDVATTRADASRDVANTRANAPGHTSFDEYMKNPEDYRSFIKSLAEIKAQVAKDNPTQAKNAGFMNVYAAQRMMEMAYKHDPALLPVIAPKVGQLLGLGPEETQILAQVPLDQPLSAVTGQPIGTAMPGAPTGATRSSAQMGERVLTEMPRIKQEVAAATGSLGPVQGRATMGFLLGKVGSTGDPALDKSLSTLKGDLTFLTSASAKFHINSVRAMEEFDRLISAGKSSEEAIQGTLDSMEQWARTAAGQQHGAGERGGGTTQTFSVDGTTYHIPANLIEEFKKDHPNAR